MPFYMNNAIFKLFVFKNKIELKNNKIGYLDNKILNKRNLKSVFNIGMPLYIYIF